MNSLAVTTITCNPTIDMSSEADAVRPTDKIRTQGERMDPGGGGINVARVLHRFGVAVEAIFLGGGVTGRVLDELLARAGIPRQWHEIAGDTRLSLTVHERSTNREYRFVPEGPCVTDEEWEPLLQTACAPWLVLSGSLPGCAPDDLYARIAGASGSNGARVILDTSGEPLRRGLAHGGLFLVKPSRPELEKLVGRPLATEREVANAARAIVAAGQSEHVAVSLGRDGAMLANADGAWFLPAVRVDTRSAVGAGDSFLAAMTFALVQGDSPIEAFRWGVAAGAATASSPGTDLCHPQQVRELLVRVEQPRSL